MDYPENYREFIRLFNSRHFFEAHEVLEDEWHKQARQNDFYKGLIQLAAAFVHVQKKQAPGALELLRKSRGYLSLCKPFRDGLDVETLCAKIGDYEDRITKSDFDLEYPELSLKKEKS